MPRISGYYWVKLKGEWKIGEYRDGGFRFIDWQTEHWDDSDFDEIDENRIERRTNPKFEVIIDPLPTLQIRTGKPNR